MVARSIRLWPALVLLVALSGAPAQSLTGSYVNGVEGIKAATLPPPGIYYRFYNVFYSADTFKAANGTSAPIGFDVFVYANVHRAIWITKKKVLGADYGMDIAVPLVNTHVKVNAAGINDTKFGLGDIWFEPLLLSWHGKRYDAAVGLGTYIPTGSFNPAEAASPGKGFWSPMLTYGATGYFDEKRTWSVSFLGRYEVHSKNTDLNIVPGHDLHFEWGVGKTFPQKKAVWDAGLAGYCQWQTTTDGAPGAVPPLVKDQVYAVGPEVSVVLPANRLIFHLRSLWEFGAEDRSQGNLTNFTLTAWW